jgi:hypothetical protein
MFRRVGREGHEKAKIDAGGAGSGAPVPVANKATTSRACAQAARTKVRNEHRTATRRCGCGREGSPET